MYGDNQQHLYIFTDIGTMKESTGVGHYRYFNKNIEFQMKGNSSFVEDINVGGIDRLKIVTRQEMLEGFSDKFVGQQIAKLNGIELIQLKSKIYRFYLGPVLGPKNPNEELIKEIHAFWSAIKKVRLQLYINTILVMDLPLEDPQFIRHDVKEPGGPAWEFSSRFIPVKNWFEDVRSMYEQAILRQSDDGAGIEDSQAR
jgi:hypothetical protein